MVLLDVLAVHITLLTGLLLSQNMQLETEEGVNWVWKYTWMSKLALNEETALRVNVYIEDEDLA